MEERRGRALYRLVAAGVRVPAPHLVHEGVLLMELVMDAAGDPAPRLNDVDFSPDQARSWHAFMIGRSCACCARG